MSFLSGLLKGLGVTGGAGGGITSGGLLPLALGGLSLLGGDDGGGQQKHSFGGKGTAGLDTNPTQALQQALNAIFRAGEGLQGRPGVQLRSSYVQPGPAPVNLPGLGIQIGGGLGRDPALADPSLLQADPARGTGPGSAISQFDPFQSQPQSQIVKAQRRTPPIG